jgi:hypothetical protein
MHTICSGHSSKLSYLPADVTAAAACAVCNVSGHCCQRAKGLAALAIDMHHKDAGAGGSNHLRH